VLNCLTAHGVPVPSSCHAGICQTCMMHAVNGKIPLSAQAGLKPTLAAQNYFLACSCYPEEDIEVSFPEAGVGKFSATVIDVKPLNSEVTCLQLRPETQIKYKPGQFISLFKDSVTARSYSLASVPAIEEHLQLHVRKVPKGLVSNWVHDELKAGDKLEISDAAGDCFYVAGNQDQNLLFIGTGSGLAPLYGIIRDSLLQGHQGSIKLYHGCETVDGLYLVKELRALSLRYPNFSYTPCISGSIASQDAASGNFAIGMVLDIALAENPQLSGWRVFLCGHPQMVNSGKREVFFAGASMQDIYADPFENALANSSQTSDRNISSADISA
jgi:ferredoxin-NADP reductase